MSWTLNLHPTRARGWPGDSPNRPASTSVDLFLGPWGPGLQSRSIARQAEVDGHFGNPWGVDSVLGSRLGSSSERSAYMACCCRCCCCHAAVLPLSCVSGVRRIRVCTACSQWGVGPLDPWRTASEDRCTSPSWFVLVSVPRRKSAFLRVC